MPNTERPKPKLWKATDLVPPRPTRWVSVNEAEPEVWRLALGIGCPSCPAKAHVPCLTPGSVVVGHHESRALKAQRRRENQRRR